MELQIGQNTDLELTFDLKLDWGMTVVTSMMNSVFEEFIQYKADDTPKALEKVRHSSLILHRLLLTDIIQLIAEKEGVSND